MPVIGTETDIPKRNSDSNGATRFYGDACFRAMGWFRHGNLAYVLALEEVGQQMAQPQPS